MSADRLFEPPLEIPAPIPVLVAGGRWGIEEWRDDAWRSLTADGAIGYDHRPDADADVVKLAAGGTTSRVVDQHQADPS